MLKNYFIIAIRNFLRQWSFSLLNLAGLTVGMASSVLIILWVIDEWSIDKFHENLDHIFRVYEKQEYAGQDPLLVYNTPGPLAPELADNFPEIRHVVRFTPLWRQLVFRSGDRLFQETNGYLADQMAFEMFTFVAEAGDPVAALGSPDNIILTKELADKYFPGESPLGQTITVDNEYQYTVAAVVYKPANTHLNFDFIIRFETNIERFWSQGSSNWNSNSFFTYVQLDPGLDYRETEEKIKDFIVDHQEQTSLYLEPLSRSYLYNIWGTGAIHNVRIFTAVAFLVLLIACINFMNLSTARSARRAKEVGLRKVSGGTRFQVAAQFLGESVLFAIAAFILAMVLVELLMPWFNELSGKVLSVRILSVPILFSFLMIMVFTGLFSGSYPALFLSSFMPVEVLKGKQKSGSKSFRRTLVVFQFSLSVALMISTMVIRKQMDYIQNKHLGFQKEHIVTLHTSAGSVRHKDLLRKELQDIPGVMISSASNNLPSRIGNSTYGINWEGKDPDQRVLFNFLHTDFDFVETFGMEMVAGRSFSREIATDSSAYLINEEAARFIGNENMIGMPFSMWGNEGVIIGIVRNFHFQDLKHNINPLVIRLSPPDATLIHLRLHPDAIASTMDEIENRWDRICPDEPVDYRFFDQQFDHMYRSEQRMSRLFLWFSVLAVVISCLGLFGLASYMAEQKRGEIGVRKAFGAGTLDVMLFMIREFTKWVVVSIFIGVPLAWYFMDRWLANFVFREGHGPFPYIIASAAAIGIAILAVGYQALKAALSNPVDTLRYE